MTDLRSLRRNFVEEFLDLYKSFPCLWKLRSKAYRDRRLKNKAYDVLVKKLKEEIPKCTKETVVKKIDSIRGNFRKEYKKVMASKRTAQRLQDIYEPTLWYYDKLLFLKDNDSEIVSSNYCKTETLDFELDDDTNILQEVSIGRFYCVLVYVSS